MKKLTLLMLAILSFTTALTGCGADDAKNEKVLPEPEPVQAPEPAPTPEPEPEPAAEKKGAAFSKKTISWSDKVADLKPHWNYNWGLNTVSQQQPDGVEFVSMKWSGSLTDEQVIELAQDYADGKFKYLLGFNEPDGVEQANMSVDDAITNWAQLEAVGAPLVSPAPVGVDNDWMNDFMTKAIAQGLKIDYIAMHSYGGASSAALLEKIDAVYAKWGIPVWITEFAVADWTADTTDANKYTPEQVLTFMQEILPALDSNANVFRYSWFSASQSSPGYNALWSSALFDENGALTPLGQFYADHTPNTNAGPGKSPELPPVDPDNIIVDANFELLSVDVWKGYNNSVVTMDVTMPYDGNFAGKLNASDGSFFQEFQLEAGKSYSVSMQTKWHNAPAAATNVALKKTGNGSATMLVALPAATEWTETAYTYDCIETGTHRIVLWKGGAPGEMFFVDNVVIKEIN